MVWAVLIFTLSSRSSVPEPAPVAALPFHDKFEHLAEYGVFATLLLLALRRGRSAPGAVASDFDPHLALMIATVYAFTDEFHQWFVPGRQADWADFLVDALGAFLFAFALSSYFPAPRGPLSPPARSVELTEGRLVYLDEGSGEPVIYLHGWHCSKRYFEGAPPRMPGFRHVRVDLFGFGDSESPRRFSYAPSDQAAAVRECARRLGLASAHVVGHSMGGAVAVELALLDPSFVRALVLVEPAIQLGVRAPFILTAKDARAVGVGFVRQFRGLDVRPLCHLIVEDPATLTPPFIEDALRVPLHSSSKALRGFARAALAPRLREVLAPALLVFGDPSHPVRAAYARKLAETMPAASLTFIPGTSHCPMIEAPDEFYRQVREFLEAVPPTARASPAVRT